MKRLLLGSALALGAAAASACPADGSKEASGPHDKAVQSAQAPAAAAKATKAVAKANKSTAGTKVAAQTRKAQGG